ncbi:MAG: phosphoserine phosphatase SerB [Candidatus Bathyarchaeota archaeon]|nr:phosphoserine phosphatase SerB [Candidatus Bathyarchaeota archaeon]
MIVAFDLEGTLIDAELFPVLGEKLGKRAQLDDITNRAMNGEIDFTSSLQQRVGLIEGLSISEAQQIAGSLSLSRGAEETVSGVKRLGGVPIIVTGGFDILAQRAAYLLGIEYVCCNRFKVKDGYITGIQTPIITGKGKAEKLLGLASWLGINPNCCVAVGDGANDIEMMRATGLSIAYNGRPRVRETAKASVEGGDLRRILPIIEEFASTTPEQGYLVNQIL